MISNIKTVTLKLSQKEFSFLMNGINAKFFMDIMSHLTASFSMDEDDTEPQLVYGPTAFFHLYELAERWKVAPEDVEHKGINCDTPLEELCLEMMSKKQTTEAIARYNSLITLHFLMITLRAFSLKKDENENTNESVNGVVLNP